MDITVVGVEAWDGPVLTCLPRAVLKSVKTDVMFDEAIALATASEGRSLSISVFKIMSQSPRRHSGQAH
jgi:hypothetical protein